MITEEGYYWVRLRDTSGALTAPVIRRVVIQPTTGIAFVEGPAGTLLSLDQYAFTDTKPIEPPKVGIEVKVVGYYMARYLSETTEELIHVVRDRDFAGRFLVQRVGHARYFSPDDFEVISGPLSMVVTRDVSRVELITDNGRAAVVYGRDAAVSLQDQGRTLKVFITEEQKPRE